MPRDAHPPIDPASTRPARLARAPGLIAAALLGAAATAGVGWSIVRTPSPAAASAASGPRVPPPADPPAFQARSPARLVRAAPPASPAPASVSDTPPATSPDPHRDRTTAAANQAASSFAQAPQSAGEPAAPGSKAEAPKPARLNLNTATAAELELLPGIGPGLAKRIVEHREKTGRFRSAAELDKVKGIGPKTIEKLRPLVTVD